MDTDPVFVGTRSIRKSGDSICVAIPRRELREQLNGDPEEMIGDNVIVSLSEAGTMQIDLSDHVDAIDNPQPAD